MKKVCVLLADGFEEIEALTVSDVMKRAKITCDLVSIKEKQVKSAHGLIIEADKIFNEKMEYDLVVIPGGVPGAPNLRNDERVISFVKKQDKEGKLIGAICAGPIVLAKAELIDGKNITSYPDYENELPNCKYSKEAVVVDGNIITSRGPATAIAFSYKLLEKLGYANEAKTISAQMLYSINN